MASVAGVCARQLGSAGSQRQSFSRVNTQGIDYLISVNTVAASRSQL